MKKKALKLLIRNDKITIVYKNNKIREISNKELALKLIEQDKDKIKEIRWKINY